MSSVYGLTSPALIKASSISATASVTLLAHQVNCAIIDKGAFSGKSRPPDAYYDEELGATLGTCRDFRRAASVEISATFKEQSLFHVDD